jgi:hypothetical protein
VPKMMSPVCSVKSVCLSEVDNSPGISHLSGHAGAARDCAKRTLFSEEHSVT